VVFVALLSLAVSAPPWVLLIAAFCAGFCISGGQKSVIAHSIMEPPVWNSWAIIVSGGRDFEAGEFS
jgi:hypothetical protein